jgi:DNA-binding CsgD family transcriptional regulator
MTAIALTPREQEVFRLMAAGLTNDEIAIQLETGVDNAKIHARHIFGKLGVVNRTDAVSTGFIEGLLDPHDIKSLRAQLKVVEPKQTEEVSEETAGEPVEESVPQ